MSAITNVPGESFLSPVPPKEDKGNKSLQLSASAPSWQPMGKAYVQCEEIKESKSVQLNASAPRWQPTEQAWRNVMNQSQGGEELGKSYELGKSEQFDGSYELDHYQRNIKEFLFTASSSGSSNDCWKVMETERKKGEARRLYKQPELLTEEHWNIGKIMGRRSPAFQESEKRLAQANREYDEFISPKLSHTATLFDPTQ